MTKWKIELRKSEVRTRLSEIMMLSGADRTDEIRAEETTLLAESRDLEQQFQACLVAEGDDGRMPGGQIAMDGETRERMALRGRARLTEYVMAAARGRMPGGAEAELQAAASVSGIPLELFNDAVPRMAGTDAPGTPGVNLDPIRPAIFARSIAARLGIDMPRVGSGTYASATISTSTTAAARPKSSDSAATAAAFTVTTATPKSISARLELTLEDIAAVGAENFEAALRENLALALSAELDNEVIAGDGIAPNLKGIFASLTNPAAPGATAADFDDFIATFAGGIDGLWASTLKDVSIVSGVDTYKLSARTFRDAAGQDLGNESFADYAMRMFGGWWTNQRMPAAESNIQQAILYRLGRSFAGSGGMMQGVRTAVCPHWNEVAIDDVYSGSSKGQRFFTFHVILGDVILIQPAAYAQVSFRVGA